MTIRIKWMRSRYIKTKNIIEYHEVDMNFINEHYNKESIKDVEKGLVFILLLIGDTYNDKIYLMKIKTIYKLSRRLYNLY